MIDTKLRRPRAALGGPTEELKGGKRRKTEEAITALMVGRTIRQAAHDCGIGYRTLKTWLASEWFQTEYQAAKKELLESTINRLRAIGGEGVAGLHDVVVNIASPPSARVIAKAELV